MQDFKITAANGYKELWHWMVSCHHDTSGEEQDFEEFIRRVEHIPDFDPGVLLPGDEHAGMPAAKSILYCTNLWAVAWAGRKWRIVRFLTQHYGNRLIQLPYFSRRKFYSIRKPPVRWEEFPLVTMSASMFRNPLGSDRLHLAQLLVELITLNKESIRMWDHDYYSCLFILLKSSTMEQLSTPDVAICAFAKALLRVGGKLSPCPFDNDFLRSEVELVLAQRRALVEVIPIPELALLVTDYAESIVTHLLCHSTRRSLRKPSQGDCKFAVQEHFLENQDLGEMLSPVVKKGVMLRGNLEIQRIESQFLQTAWDSQDLPPNV